MLRTRLLPLLGKKSIFIFNKPVPPGMFRYKFSADLQSKPVIQPINYNDKVILPQAINYNDKVILSQVEA